MNNRTNKNCVVVIPIHSPSPSRFELMSLAQCFKVLYKYDIRIVAPKGLDIAEYKKLNPHLEVIYIDPMWQSDIMAYNRLKINKYFYSLFLDYEYVLTYELDAYVFRDELADWCNKGYTYIGAPWFKRSSKDTFSTELIGVGNSGFSLRSVHKSFYCARRAEKLNKLSFFLKIFISLGYRLGKKEAFDRFISALLNIKTTKEIIFFNSIGFVNEDYYYTQCFGKTFKGVEIAPTEDALKFSFEVYPRILFEMNKNTLPFGCHAFLKYDKSFWFPFFEKNGHNINE